jgi:hypothetical protein
MFWVLLWIVRVWERESNANEQVAIVRMKALRAKGAPLREISKAIASEFHIEMPTTGIKRILDREVVRRAGLGPKKAKVLTDTDVDR